MFEFLLRFFGRFVFAQQRDRPDVVRVLAIDMQHNQYVVAEPHRAVLSVPRGMVIRERSTPADLMVMACTSRPLHQLKERLEHAVWELEGFDVLIEADTGLTFDWDDKGLLLNLGTLAGTDRLSPSVDNPNPEVSPVTAVIDLRVGRATAVSLFRERVQMVPLGNPGASTPVIEPADLVEVAIASASAEIEVRLKRRDGTGPTSSIRITTDRPEGPTVINFSNLCGRRDAGPIDEEFAGLYEVLAEPPHLPNRQVPKHLSGLGAVDDCYIPTHLVHP